jgi:hypothetical protein
MGRTVMGVKAKAPQQRRRTACLSLEMRKGS